MRNRIINVLKNVTDLTTGEITSGLNADSKEHPVTRGTVAKCLTRMVRDNMLLRTPQNKYRLPTVTLSPA